MRVNWLLSAAVILNATSPACADGREAKHRGPSVSAVVDGPIAVLAEANDASRRQPSLASFHGARQIYTYELGAIYELYTSPNYVSTIVLEPGESLTNIAAGDTSRWIVTQAEGESESDGRTLVLVKPQAPNLRTNLVLITDRRTYLIDVISQAGAAYSAQVAWSYPPNTEEPVQPSPPAGLNVNYRVRTVQGERPVWTPARVYDDGRRTYIEFAPDVVASDLPPLFIITPDGAELTNYRVQSEPFGQRYMVDRIFDVAELRLGSHAPIVVRIERNPHEPTPWSRRPGSHP
jgi:type IV secretion system protein VirB9